MGGHFVRQRARMEINPLSRDNTAAKGGKEMCNVLKIEGEKRKRGEER